LQRQLRLVAQTTEAAMEIIGSPGKFVLCAPHLSLKECKAGASVGRDLQNSYGVAERAGIAARPETPGIVGCT